MSLQSNWDPNLDIENIHKPATRTNKAKTDITVSHSQAVSFVLASTTVLLITAVLLQLFVLIPFLLYNYTLLDIKPKQKPNILSPEYLYQVESKVKGQKICLYLKQYKPLLDIGKYEVSVVKQQIFDAIQQEVEVFEVATEWKEEAKILEAQQNI